MTKTAIATKEAPAAIGPYSQAVRAGDWLFVSGQLPIDPATGAMPEGVREQTRRVLANLGAVLGAAGMDLRHVVKTTVFMTDLKGFAEMNEEYAKAFASSSPAPARATVEVRALPKAALVEIEAVARAG